MGVKEQEHGNVRLFKWALAVQRTHNEIWETYSVPEIISAQLLALTAEQATYKFLIYSGNLEDAEDVLLVSEHLLMSIWIRFINALISFGYSVQILSTPPHLSLPSEQ